MRNDAREPDEYDAIAAVVQAALAEINTCLPGKVIKWDPARPHVADVQPVIQRVYLDDDGNEQALDQPVITDAPIAWPQGGGFVLTFPLKPGDPVELRFAQRSLDRWLASDGATPHDCGDNRRFNLSDAIVCPGLATKAFAAASSDSVLLAATDDSAHVRITDSGEVQIKAGAVRLGTDGASKALAKATETVARLSAIETKLMEVATALAALTGGAFTPFVPDTSNPASSKAFTDA